MSPPPTTFGSGTAERDYPAAGDFIALPPSGEATERPAPPARAPLGRLRADPARMAAIGDCVRALLLSRLVIWVGGVAAVLALGLKVKTSAFDPPGVTSGFGWLGDRLVAPAARWDSAWYLAIAQHGYEAGRGLATGIWDSAWYLSIARHGFESGGGVATSSRAAFFPLYPLLIGAIGRVGVPLVLAGMLVSLVALAVALYGLHRLTTLELSGDGDQTARLTVLLVAFFPMSFFLSAVYSESLYLALSIGVFWAARHGRFAIACALAGLAGATRSAGIVLVVPIVLLYLYGPRADRPPDRAHPLRGGSSPPWWGRGRGLLPRYRVRRDAWALALVPLGLAAYMGYLAASGGDALMPFHAQAVWSRELAGPLRTLWLGTVAAFDGVRQLLSGQTAHKYFAAGHGNPLIAAEHNVVDWLFLVVAAVAIVGVLRTLPFAYGAYVLAALLLPLSYPVSYEPLMSLPRFLAVLFPLFMWAGARLAAAPRARAPVLAGSTVCLLFFVAQFATWHWVA